MKLPRRATAVIAGAVLGILAVEGAFRLRDRGAFPHLNVYRPDAKLGVRLRPGSHERISFSDNPVSQVRINAQGYRGADWPAHADDEILIVGDSQAFGLGVDEAEAFAWKLGELLHRPIANAAVPTYGPGEYDDVLAEELPRRHPKTVVYTVNLANDLFESVHANVTRHAVWDGWAVRRETAPRGIRHFPGRHFLFTDSHAFFALRGLWWRWTGPGDEGAVASEGGWQDLLALGRAGEQQRTDARVAIERGRVKRDADSDGEQARLDELDRRLGKRIGASDPFNQQLLLAAEASPGDIVMRGYGEGSAPVPLTAEQIAHAAALRHAFEDEARAQHDDATLAKLAERDRLSTAVRSRRSADEAHPPTPIYAHLARAKQLCDANGAELVVLVLPLDVQVSSAEWAKYHAPRQLDLSSSRILAWDVLQAADELGARTLDAWPVLAAAEPGAFLNGDLHMSDKGHARVAESLARLLRAPRHALAPLPPGRSAVPSPGEWARAPLALSGYPSNDYLPTRDSLGCAWREVREWIRVDCTNGAFDVDQPDTDLMVVNHAGGGSFIVAKQKGHGFSTRFIGPARMVRFALVWPLNAEPWFSVYAPQKLTGERWDIPAVTPAEAALCECQRQATGSTTCDDLYGSVEPGCARAYGDDCERLLACARGDRRAPPTCAAQETMSPVAQRCVAAEKR